MSLSGLDSYNLSKYIVAFLHVVSMSFEMAISILEYNTNKPVANGYVFFFSNGRRNQLDV